MSSRSSTSSAKSSTSSSPIPSSTSSWRSSPTTVSPTKRAVSCLAPDKGWIESRVKKKRRSANTSRFDASPVKQQQQLQQQQSQSKRLNQKQKRRQRNRIIVLPKSKLKRSSKCKSTIFEGYQPGRPFFQKASVKSRGSASKSPAPKSKSTVPASKLPSTTSKSNKLPPKSSVSASKPTATPSKSLNVPSKPTASKSAKVPAVGSSKCTSNDSKTHAAVSTPLCSPQKTVLASIASPSSTSQTIPCRKAAKCSICGKVYSRPDNMRRHVETMHQKKSLFCKCRLCGESFGSLSLRESHMKEAHKVHADSLLLRKTGNKLKKKSQQRSAQSVKREKAKPKIEQEKPSTLEMVMKELLGDDGNNVENAVFAERVRSKWFESPSKSSLGSQTPPSPVKPLTHTSASSPTKLSQRALIQKIVMSKNGKKSSHGILKNHIPDPNVQS